MPILQEYNSVINLQDFTTDPVYQKADDRMKAIFDKMIKREDNGNLKEPTSIFIPS